jgi:hypothetical protein
MTTDPDTRIRIAAMAAAEAAIERDPRDPFAVLPQTSAEAAAHLGVDARAVFPVADGIVVEALIEMHFAPDAGGTAEFGATIAAR